MCLNLCEHVYLDQNVHALQHPLHLLLLFISERPQQRLQLASLCGDRPEECDSANRQMLMSQNSHSGTPVSAAYFIHSSAVSQPRSIDMSRASYT